MKEPGAFWRVPRMGEGPCFILGGGSSLKGFDAARLRGRLVIAINDAGLYLFPDAEILYFADGLARWAGWNRDKIGLFRGREIVTRSTVSMLGGRIVRRVRQDDGADLAREPDAVAGFCSGANALNIAFHLGARRIYLLGYDMGGGHWHDHHKTPARDVYATHMIPAINRMAGALDRAGVQVFNCSRVSRLACFPFADIDEVLP